jgi:hypothetical protein
MADGEGVVMVCPTVFQMETVDGPLVAALISYWREKDTYAQGKTGHARLFFPTQVARELARRLLEEADKIEEAAAGREH